MAERNMDGSSEQEHFSPEAARFTRTWRLLEGRKWWLPFALFLLAGAVRCLYVIQAASSPPGNIPLVDAETYSKLALRLVRGHTVDAALFWQPVLYPLYLSAVYAATGCSVVAAQIVQAILGGITCVLTFVVGERILGRNVGIAAGLITALYGPLVFFESELQATGLAALFSVLLVLLFLRMEVHPGSRLSLLAGLLAAAAIMIRPTFAPFLLASFLWLAVVIRRRFEGREMRRMVLYSVLGFLLAATPVAIANHQYGLGRFTILPDSGGINAYIGNNNDICKTLTVRPGWEWSSLIATPYRQGVSHREDCQRFFYREVGHFAIAHPLRFLENMVWKTARFVSSREIPRNLDLYVYRQWSSLLRVLLWKIGGFGFPFGVLLPLAAVGAWCLRRRIPVIVWLFLGLFPLSVILIFPSDRYRVPAVPILSVLAAGGLVAVIEFLRRHEWRNLGFVGGLAAGVVAMSVLPGPFCEERVNYTAEIKLLLGLASFNGIQAAQDETEIRPLIRKAREQYEEAIALEPAYADAYNELGNLDVVEGRPGDALGRYERALRIDPDHGKALHNLGVLLFKLGYNKEAAVCLRRAVDLDPSFVRSRYFLGRALLAQGQLDEAIQSLQFAAGHETDPQYQSMALAAMGDAKVEAGDSREAVSTYQRALRLYPESGSALLGLAWVLATDPDPTIRDGTTALLLAEKAQTLESSSPEARDVLAAAYAEIGDFAKAMEIARAAAAAARGAQEVALAAEIEGRLAGYGSGQPYRR